MDQVLFRFGEVCGHGLLYEFNAYLLLIFLSEHVDNVLDHILMLPALLTDSGHENSILHLHSLVVVRSFVFFNDFLVAEHLLLLGTLPHINAHGGGARPLLSRVNRA